jgi:threonylcarbamoyladenosine tRNA methylthiotransferase MtaB
MPETFFVENFGCRATQADGAAIERSLLQRGLIASEHRDRASVVVLNTCTVTAEADKDARAAIRRVHHENPDSKILVTGCYAQRAPQEIAELPGVTWVVGNSHKTQIAEVISPAGRRDFVPVDSLNAHFNYSITPSQDHSIFVSDIFAHTELLAAPVFEASTHSEKTRPNLKVQDGCNNRCSFCVIPYTRGQSRSLALEEAVREVNELVAAGYKEVVISGINLGRWGRDFSKQARFEELVRTVLDRTALEKLRISSVEPMDWSDELIELVASSQRIAKHAHVPLQSGSDAILRRMHRKYRPWHYEERVRKIRGAMPEAAIGADVMVGFPGETHELFEESRAFIASLPFTYLHVFTYSARPGTPAADMPGQVPVQVARERNRILRELAAQKNFQFRHYFVGKTIPAITLHRSDESGTEALTDNFLKVHLEGKHEANEWVRVQVTSATSDGLAGRLSLY